MISYLEKPVLTVILGVVCLLDPCSGAADPFASNGTPQYVAGERVMFYHPKYKAWARGNVIESTIISQSNCDHYLYHVQDDENCEIHEVLEGGLRAIGSEPEPQRQPRPAAKKAGKRSKRRARGRTRKPNTLSHPTPPASESGWSTAATVGDVQSAKNDSNYEYMTPEQSRACVDRKVPLSKQWYAGDGKNIDPKLKRQLVRGGQMCTKFKKQGQWTALLAAPKKLNMVKIAQDACDGKPGYGFDASLDLKNKTLQEQHPEMCRTHQSRSRSVSREPRRNVN